MRFALFRHTRMEEWFPSNFKSMIVKKLLPTVAFSLSTFHLMGQHFVNNTLLYLQKSEYPILVLFVSSGVVFCHALYFSLLFSKQFVPYCTTKHIY